MEIWREGNCGNPGRMREEWKEERNARAGLNN